MGQVAQSLSGSNSGDQELSAWHSDEEAPLVPESKNLPEGYDVRKISGREDNPLDLCATISHSAKFASETIIRIANRWKVKQ